MRPVGIVRGMRIHHVWHRLPLLAGLLVASLAAAAASNGRLPAWVCGAGDPPLFADGFEPGGNQPHAEPSGGSGGAYPGPQTRSIEVLSLSMQYYLYVPNGYPFARPAPLVLVLHGAGGMGTAPAAAQSLRDLWATTADAGGFLVAAPVASGAQGGWVPGIDYDQFQAVIEDVASHYDIDRSRIHGWGFSAGGHVMHDLGLNRYPSEPIPDQDTFAAYAVSAGLLKELVCGDAGQPSCSSFLPQVARKIPIQLRVGISDPMRNAVKNDRDALQAAGWSLGLNLDFALFSGGHEIDPAELPAAWNFFCPFQRLPD